MMSLFAFYWRGDEYDLSSWQGWLKILVGLMLWTIVSGMGRAAVQKEQRKHQETNSEIPVPNNENNQDKLL